MFKRYYTLQEAADLLSERSGDKVSVADVLDLCGDRAIRICAIFQGWLEIESELAIEIHGFFEVRDDRTWKPNRTSIDLCIQSMNPVEIKSFEPIEIGAFEPNNPDLLQRYIGAIENAASQNKEIRFLEKLDAPADLSAPLDECLVPKEDLDKLLANNDSPKRKSNQVLVAAVKHRWWQNADKDESDTQPTQAQVVEWLMKEHKTSERQARTVATDARPDWAFKGRKPKF